MNRPLLVACGALMVTIVCMCSPFSAAPSGSGSDGGTSLDSAADGPAGSCWTQAGASLVTFDDAEGTLPADYFDRFSTGDPPGLTFTLVPKDPPRVFQVSGASPSPVDPDMWFKPFPLTGAASAGTRLRITEPDPTASPLTVFAVHVLDATPDAADVTGDVALYVYVQYLRGVTTFQIVGRDGSSLSTLEAATPIAPDQWTAVEVRVSVDPPQLALYLDGGRVTPWTAVPSASLSNKTLRTCLALTGTPLTSITLEFDDVCMLAP